MSIVFLIRIIVVAGALLSVLAGSASASYRIYHASVPGIGRIGTTLPSDTEVRPPGRIPDAKPITASQFNKQFSREGRLAERVNPGPDSGPTETVRRIKRQVGRNLFLRKIVSTCVPYSKAALWVYYFIHASPGRRPYINSLETNRRQFEDESPKCWPRRLRIDRWQGVRIDRVDDQRARAMLRGAVEFKENGQWRSGAQRIWKLALRLDNDRWRIAINFEEFVNDNEGEGD